MSHLEEQTWEEKVIMAAQFMVTRAVNPHLATAMEGNVHLQEESLLVLVNIGNKDQ